MAAGAVDITIITPHAKACAIFDGIDDKIEVAKNFSHNMVKGITISGWCKTTDTNGMIFCKYHNEGGAGQPYDLYLDGDSFRIGVLTAGGVDTLVHTATVNDNLWHHFIGTYDGTTLCIYSDGVKESKAHGTPGNIVNYNSKIEMGQWGGNGQPLTCQIADIRLWNRALSESECTKIYAGENIKESLVSQWTFEDGTATDLMGVNNGTMNGGSFSKRDDLIAAAVKAARVSANDRWTIAETANKQIIITHIEEAP